jgi:hypothetical protein
MHPAQVRLLLVFALPLLAGCATSGRGAGEGVGFATTDPGEADLESAPKLIRCQDIGRTPFERVYRVGLQFVVLEDGTVDGSSIAPVNVPRTTLNYPDWAVEEAVSIAIGCRFEPATRDGVAVSAPHIRIFRILRRLEGST